MRTAVEVLEWARHEAAIAPETEPEAGDPAWRNVQATAKRIAENEGLRQAFERLLADAKWMSEGPKHTSPVSAAWEVGFKEAVTRLRAALEAQP